MRNRINLFKVHFRKETEGYLCEISPFGFLVKKVITFYRKKFRLHLTAKRLIGGVRGYLHGFCRIFYARTAAELN